MSATYDQTLSTNKDHIRLALGDTDMDNPLLQDETIEAKLTAFGYTEALAQLAEALASQYAQQPDSFGDDGLTISWRDRVSNWQALAKSARANVAPPPESETALRGVPIVRQTTVQSATNTGVMAGFRST